jgi:hypothetical protein
MLGQHRRLACSAEASLRIDPAPFVAQGSCTFASVAPGFRRWTVGLGSSPSPTSRRRSTALRRG